jgi:hypothetical protein
MPDVAQRVPGGLGSQIFMTFGTWRWWGHQPHAPAAFSPRKCSWYSFSLGAELTPGPWCGQKEICHWKVQWCHQESISGPSDLNHYATPKPHINLIHVYEYASRFSIVYYQARGVVGWLMLKLITACNDEMMHTDCHVAEVNVVIYCYIHA